MQSNNSKPISNPPPSNSDESSTSTNKQSTQKVEEKEVEVEKLSECEALKKYREGLFNYTYTCFSNFINHPSQNLPQLQQSESKTRAKTKSK